MLHRSWSASSSACYVVQLITRLFNMWLAVHPLYQNESENWRSVTVATLWSSPRCLLAHDSSTWGSDLQSKRGHSLIITLFSNNLKGLKRSTVSRMGCFGSFLLCSLKFVFLSIWFAVHLQIAIVEIKFRKKCEVFLMRGIPWVAETLLASQEGSAL